MSSLYNPSQFTITKAGTNGMAMREGAGNNNHKPTNSQVISVKSGTNSLSKPNQVVSSSQVSDYSPLSHKVLQPVSTHSTKVVTPL